MRRESRQAPRQGHWRAGRLRLEPVRHQVKYSLKTSISISYINIPVQTGSQAGEREGKRVPQQHTDGQERWAGGQWGGGGMWGGEEG